MRNKYKKSYTHTQTASLPPSLSLCFYAFQGRLKYAVNAIVDIPLSKTLGKTYFISILFLSIRNKNFKFMLLLKL